MKEGIKVGISIHGKKAVLNVLPDDPVDAGCGYLSGMDQLLTPRRGDAEILIH